MVAKPLPAPARTPTFAQAVAICTRDRPVLMLSGPGTGKTETLASRYRRHLAEGLKPSEVMAAAYTNEAADNFRERAGVPVCDRDAWVGTVHSLAARILRASPGALRLRSRFEVIDEDRSARIMENALSRVAHPRASDVANAREAVRDMLSIATIVKSLAEGRADAAGWLAAGTPGDEHDRKAVLTYVRLCRDANVADYDDLLLGARLALARGDSGMKAVLVDEYQDLSRLALDFIQAVVGASAQFIAAADADQSVFGWRGANVAEVNAFRSRYPQAKLVKLDKSFRLPSAILAPAMKLVGVNEDRIAHDIVSAVAQTGNVGVKLYANEEAERRGVAQHVKALVDAGNRPSSIAVFARTHIVVTGLAAAIADEDVPVITDDDFKLNAPGVSGYVAACRLARGSLDATAFEDAARDLTTIREATIEEFIASLERANAKRATTDRVPMDYASALAKIEPGDGSPEAADRAELAMLSHLITEVGTALETGAPPFVAAYLAAREALPASCDGELVRELAGFLDSVNESLANVDDTLGALCLAKKGKPKPEAVRVMTCHSAKGREFAHTVVAGFEEGLMPMAGDPSRLAEERRLAFVALTRAKSSVRITASGWRRNRESSPSRFIVEAGLMQAETVTA